jgi:hypothetical protein
MVLIPSPSVKIQIMGGKVGLRCKSKTLLKKIKTKNSNVHDSLKVMGLNPVYLLKSSLLYCASTNGPCTSLYWNSAK